MGDKDIRTLIEETEKISAIEECRTCQCFYDMLLEFKEVLKKEKISEDMEARLEAVIQGAQATHDCLGCDPCYPVPLSNTLAEMSGSLAVSCGSVCKPRPIKLMTLKPSWPIEQGEYIVGHKISSIALSTLGNDDLAEPVLGKTSRKRELFNYR